MNKATLNLENDHVHILKLIDVMESITAIQDPDVQHLETIVYLIKNFADGLHHAKEENLLFPKMAEKGFSFQQGPLAVMMNEHVIGRDYVKGMSVNIKKYKEGNIAALNDIYKNMHGYIQLLRAHISKENNVLFRMADNVINSTEQEELLKEFKKVEENHLNSNFVADCLEKINDLAKFYNIPQIAV